MYVSSNITSTLFFSSLIIKILSDERDTPSWDDLTTLYVLPCYMQQLLHTAVANILGHSSGQTNKIEGSRHTSTHKHTQHTTKTYVHTHTHKFWIWPHRYNRGWAAWSGWPRPDHLQSRCFAAVVRFDLINKGLDRGVGLRNPGIEMCWRPASHCEIICLWFWDDVSLVALHFSPDQINDSGQTTSHFCQTALTIDHTID